MPTLGEWHALSPAEALLRLGSAPGGLAEEEAAARLARHGPNELAAAPRVSALALLAAQLRNVLVLVLLVAVALSALLGHGLEAAAIAVIVLLAVLLGFVQEYRAEHALQALRRLAAPTVTVLRDGREQRRPAREVVPGDVVVLSAGDRVACDARLLEALDLHLDEAPLTGESLPVPKQAAALPPGAVAVADRSNLVFAGTAVTRGRGRAVAVATGAGTEFGGIARLLDAVEPARTPLQASLDGLGRGLARAAVAVVGLVVALGLVRGQPVVDLLVFGIALAVAVVPEALPAVVTISLALGAQRLARRNALIRRLAAAETLGSTSVICSDKTGTLTKGEMTVRALHAGGQALAVTGTGYDPRGDFLLDGQPVAPPRAAIELLRAAALASDARLERTEGGWALQGDPTEGALVVAAAKAGLSRADLEREHPRLGEVAFTAESKRMATFHRAPGGVMACVKGAPEVVMASCSRILTASGERELGDAERASVLAVAGELAGRALRVLAVARRLGPAVGPADRGLTLLGLAGMLDPPRPEARAALQRCAEAGVKVVMITGDHPLTARAVAAELGLGGGRLVTGAELEALPDGELERIALEVDVYARVSPADKLRVVAALQRRGQVVAMTGDGVNDAPALRQADIGIAMGLTGTEVTKEAAAMTLVDDNFASIVGAVEEGRAIYENVRKYLVYLLASNAGEIGVMAGASLLGLPLPLSAVQILYVNLATDGLPALALAVDPPADDLMRRPPRDGRAGIFSRSVVALILVGGAWSALLVLGVFAWALGSGRAVAQAMSLAFAALVLVQFVNAYVFRAGRGSLLHRPFANRWLNLAVAWEFLLLGAVLHVPALQALFGTLALAPADWLVVGGAALGVAPVLEAAKAWLRRAGKDAGVGTGKRK